MLFLLNIPAQIISLFDSNLSDSEIAAGVVLAFFLGLIPLNGPMAILLFIFFFVFKINRLSTALVLPVLKLFYLAGLWRLTDCVGGWLLIDAPGLGTFWAKVTHAPVLALLDLNNTLVAGGLALAVILALPVYFMARTLSKVLKAKVYPRLKQSKLVKSLSKITWVNKLADFINNLRNKVDVQ